MLVGCVCAAVHGEVGRGDRVTQSAEQVGQACRGAWLSFPFLQLGGIPTGSPGRGGLAADCPLWSLALGHFVPPGWEMEEAFFAPSEELLFGKRWEPGLTIHSVLQQILPGSPNVQCPGQALW